MPAAQADHRSDSPPGSPHTRRPTRRADAMARWGLSAIAAVLIAIWLAGQWYTAILRTPALASGWFAAVGIGQGAFVVGWTTKPELARHAGAAQLAPSGAADHWLPRFAHSPAGVQIIAPVWILLVATGAPAALLWAREVRRRRWARAGRCHACGYPMPPGSAHAACPECGRIARADRRAPPPNGVGPRRFAFGCCRYHQP